jgi:hypothetical protein
MTNPDIKFTNERLDKLKIMFSDVEGIDEFIKVSLHYLQQRNAEESETLAEIAQGLHKKDNNEA